MILLRCPEDTEHLLHNTTSKFESANDCILSEEISFGRIKENGMYDQCNHHSNKYRICINSKQFEYREPS